MEGKEDSGSHNPGQVKMLGLAIQFPDVKMAGTVKSECDLNSGHKSTSVCQFHLSILNTVCKSHIT